MLRVHLTGRVSLSGDGATVDEHALAGRIGRLVLVRLALEHHPIDRERLVEDIWPDDPPPSVESVLNATFSRLRSAMAVLGLDGKEVLRSSGGVAELRPPVGTRIDVVTALQSIDAAEGARRRGDAESAWAGAVVTHSIARRPLLPGVDRVWLDIHRNRLHHALERSFAVLSDVWMERGDPHQSATIAREAVRHAPYSEAAHRRLVTALLAQGDRAAAGQAVGEWERILRDDLGLADDRLRSLLG